MDTVYNRLSARLQGLVDQEYFWEPAPDCWTVHRDGDKWVADHVLPEPDPAPVTTIAWQFAHLTQGKTVYRGWAFGSGSLAVADVVPAATAVEAIEQLDSAHSALRTALGGLTEADPDEGPPTVWGEPWPTWRIASGEVGTVPDRWRPTAAGVGPGPCRDPRASATPGRTVPLERAAPTRPSTGRPTRAAVAAPQRPRR